MEVTTITTGPAVPGMPLITMAIPLMNGAALTMEVIDNTWGNAMVQPLLRMDYGYWIVAIAPMVVTLI